MMSAQPGSRPRIGIPYRTRKEELTPGSDKIEKYMAAVRSAGGEPVPVFLGLSREELAKFADSLSGFVLSGSPADVEPSLFGAAKHRQTNAADSDRERTDFALLEHAFARHKPVLAICYGIQSLNVFLGGTLVQDIPDELGSVVLHDWEDDVDPETFHTVSIEPGSRLAQLAGTNEARVNSSHHQSVLKAGRNLRVVARASDGVTEAVEWTGDADWVTGVQWHPERMAETDAFAQTMFRELVAAARDAEASNSSQPLPASERLLSR